MPPLLRVAPRLSFRIREFLDLFSAISLCLSSGALRGTADKLTRDDCRFCRLLNGGGAHPEIPAAEISGQPEMITGNLGGKAWLGKRFLGEPPDLPSHRDSCSVSGVAVLPDQRRVTPPKKTESLFRGLGKSAYQENFPTLIPTMLAWAASGKVPRVA